MKNIINKKVFTQVSSNKDERKCVLAQVLVGLDLVRGIDPNKITAKDCKRLKNEINNALQAYSFRDLMDYLEDVAFSTKLFGRKYLTKENAAAIFLCARRAMLNDISAEDFNTFCKKYAYQVLSSCADCTMEKKLYYLTAELKRRG